LTLSQAAYSSLFSISSNFAFFSLACSKREVVKVVGALVTLLLTVDTKAPNLESLVTD
jgi:hypothetical protein